METWVYWRRLAVLAVLTVSSTFGQRNLFTPTDIWAWRYVIEVRIAPDGKSAIYAETWPTRNGAATYSNLWTVATDGRGRAQLTEGEWRDWSPRWAAEAPVLAYLSNRGGHTQIRIRRIPSGPDMQAGELDPGAARHRAVPRRRHGSVHGDGSAEAGRRLGASGDSSVPAADGNGTSATLHDSGLGRRPGLL